jgi:hypothetical protein
MNQNTDLMNSDINLRNLRLPHSFSTIDNNNMAVTQTSEVEPTLLANIVGF